MRARVGLLRAAVLHLLFEIVYILFGIFHPQFFQIADFLHFILRKLEIRDFL